MEADEQAEYLKIVLILVVWSTSCILKGIFTVPQRVFVELFEHGAIENLYKMVLYGSAKSSARKKQGKRDIFSPTSVPLRVQLQQFALTHLLQEVKLHI